MAYRKPSKGQPRQGSVATSAAFFTDAVDVVNDYKAGKRPPRGPDTHGVDTNEVQVRNQTCGDRVRGEVVQLGLPLLTSQPDNPYHPWFEGRLVAAPVDQRWAILTKPIPACEIGPAQVAGRALARVNIASVSHTHAVPVAGQFTLASATAGYIELLSPPVATGLQEVWVRLWQPSTSETTTTTTTTTPEPGVGIDCKWLWNDADAKWTLDDESGCSAAATTTTTTEDPCGCPTSTTTTTVDPEATTTTTTTAEPEYTCQYPTFCGDEDGECTYTPCVLIGNEEQSPPECTTTTTSTTEDPETTTTPDPETTTTTVDCNTTTVDPLESCNGSCLWAGDPISGAWSLVSGCGSSIDCAGRNVCGGCASPAVAVSICSTTSTDCVPLPPPVQGGPTACTGSHSYVCGLDNQWHWVGGSCSGGSCPGCPNCYGIYPWLGPNCSAGPAPAGPCNCADTATINCRPGPCTPCGSGSPGYDPCATTTTPDPETTTTTTTTADPCGTDCKWEANGEVWSSAEDNCLGDCNCPYPSHPPHDDCEVARTKCVAGPPPPTTTTPVPTTTTTPPPTTTTTTTATPYYCNCFEPDFDTGNCVQGVESITDFNCGGPFATLELCQAAAPCDNPPTTTPPPTTTTTTPAPQYWCLDLGSGNECIEGEGNEGVYYGGPYNSLIDCEEIPCSTTTTTTTTTCDPSYNCTNGCTFYCDSNSGFTWQLAPVCEAIGNPAGCRCDMTEAEYLLLGTSCSGLDDNFVVPCCNPCSSGADVCQNPVYTTTTPAP